LRECRDDIHRERNNNATITPRQTNQDDIPLCHVHNDRRTTVKDDKGTTWEKIDITVDSGAAEFVMPKNTCNDIPISSTDASRNNMHFRVANGQRIPNYGMRHVKGLDEMGRTSGFKAQVTDVGGVLGAVSKMTEAGNIVIFDEVDGHRIINRKSGRITPMRKENGVFKTSLWVRTNEVPPVSNIETSFAGYMMDESPFQGQDNELI